MAFNIETWLSQMMEQKDSAGRPLYSTETLQDVVALVLLSGDEPFGPVPDPLAKILAAFMTRSGMTTATDAASLQKALDGYFAAHPLPASLTASLQAEFRRSSQDTPFSRKLHRRSIRG
jgi:hypothetical protein